MNDAFFVSIVTFVYFLSAFIFLVSVVFRKAAAGKIATGIAVGGLMLHSLALIIRWVHSYQLGIGHAPLSNFYESLVFCSWSIVFIFLIIRKQYKSDLIGMLSVFFAFLILAYVSLSGTVDCQIQPLIPALQSNWLISHVISSFLAYGCFAIAFGLSILYLFKKMTNNNIVKSLPDTMVKRNPAFTL